MFVGIFAYCACTLRHEIHLPSSLLLDAAQQDEPSVLLALSIRFCDKAWRGLLRSRLGSYFGQLLSALVGGWRWLFVFVGLALHCLCNRNLRDDDIIIMQGHDVIVAAAR